MVTKRVAATTKRATSVKAALSKSPKSPFHPLYGRPILDAVKRGDPAELRRIRAAAVKQVNEIQSALKKLDAKLGR